MDPEILDERTLTIAEAADIVRSDVATVRRWISQGIGGVRLRAIKAVRKTLTSREALREFFAAVSPEKPPPAALVAKALDERVRRARATWDAPWTPRRK